MKIETLKELEALVKLCRKTGIDSIEVSGIKLQLGSAPSKKLKTEPSNDTIETPGQLTDEELLMWSSAGING